MATRTKQGTGIHGVVLLGALVLCIFLVVVLIQNNNAYRQARLDGEQNAKRLTRILSDHAESTFLGVRLTLERAIDQQRFNALFGNNLPEYTEQNFRVWLKETSHVTGLALVDERGVVRVNTRKAAFGDWLDGASTLQGQSVFDDMKDADDRYTYFGHHVTPSGKPLILLAKRYDKTDGSFGGVVIAGLNPDYFLDFYASIATGKQNFMTLSLPDSSFLASGPSQDPVKLALLKKMLETQTEEDLHDPKTNIKRSNNVFYIIATQELTSMQVLVSVVIDEDDFLANWRKMRQKDLGLLALFVIFCSALMLISIAMARQFARMQASEEAAILASQAKSEFLANMSHELRTPLNAIIGFSEMLNSTYFGPLNAKQKERIHDIHLCGSHLLQLISDILEFSKGDAGKLELVEEKVDLAGIVDESVRIMAGKFKTKDIDISSVLEPELPAVWGDKRKVRQVLLNLLSNAAKFTPEGGAVKVVCRLDAQRNLWMQVSDTGMGIAEADIPKALSVFGQVHRSKSHEGTGLGLPLCKMYAELHGGKLVVTSKVGEGTTVKVMFPTERVLFTKGEDGPTPS